MYTGTEPAFRFLIYGPASRLVLAAALVALATGAVAGAPDRRRNVALAGFGLALLAALAFGMAGPVASAAETAEASALEATRIGIELSAAILAGAAALLLVRRRPDYVRTTVLLPVGIGITAEQSLLFVAAGPWTGLWWTAHVVGGAGALLLAWSVLVDLQEAERRREVERLRELDAVKAQVIATAAHELEQPLEPLRAELKRLRTGLVGRSKTERKSVETLERNVAHLQALVKDLLERPRDGKAALELETGPVDLNDVVHLAVDSFQRTAQEQGIAMDVKATPDLLVIADRVRLTQVLFNLLSNALRHTGAGGMITLETAREPGAAVVRVRDTGIGIHPEEIDRLLEPAPGADPASREAAGPALGLRICRAIIEKHGGRLWWESPGPERGAVFAFALPALKTAEALGGR